MSLPGHLACRMTDLRIATRRSPLALAQARLVASALEAAHPGLGVSLVEVDSSGDADRNSPVAALTEVGAFVRAVQQEVLDGKADVAVHSCKDLPVDGPSELIVFYTERDSPWDVLCGSDLAGLPAGARVGTGSPRRAAQLRRLRPDVDVAEIRGNVETRLAKMRSGEYGAVVLAEAGLRRLGLGGEIGHRFTLDEMVPAPAQAVLAVEAIAGSESAELVGAIDDAATRRAMETERGLLAMADVGCRSAVGVYVSVDDGITATGFIEDDRGARTAVVTASDPTTATSLLFEALGISR